jgi:radical SAM protein with 4Fe4S-binding SPASM domain
MNQNEHDEAPVDHEFYFQWHITERCNRRCRHCYQETYDSAGELSDELLLMVADRLTDALKAWGRRGSVGLTGGEPWLRPGVVVAILDRLAAGGQVDRVDLMTNGTLLSENDCAILARHALLRRVQVSLEGATADCHDAIRGPRSFDETIQAITRMKHAGLTVAVMMTISRQNMSEIVPLLELVGQLGGDVFSMDRFIPEGQGTQHREWLLSTAQVRDCYQTLYRWAMRGRKPRVLMYRPLFCLIDSTSPHVGAMCSVGVNALTILQDGSVYPCRRLPIVLGNVMKDSLHQIFYESDQLWKVRVPSNLRGRCSSCQFLPICRGCRAMALAVTGDWLEEDPHCWLGNDTQH